MEAEAPRHSPRRSTAQRSPGRRQGEAARATSPRRSRGEAARATSPRRSRGEAARATSPRRRVSVDSPRRRACLESQPLCKSQCFEHLSESFEQRYLNVDPKTDVEMTLDDLMHVRHRNKDVRLMDGSIGIMPSTYASSDEDDESVTDDSDDDSLASYSGDHDSASEYSNDGQMASGDRELPSEESVYDSGSDSDTLSHVSASR